MACFSPLAKILCIVGCIELVHYLSKEALIASQEVRSSNNLQFCIQALRVVGLLAVIPFGLTGACYGLLVASFASFALSQRHLNLAIKLQLRDVFRACSISGVATILSVAPIALGTLYVEINETNYLRCLVAASGVFIPLWLLSLKWLKHPLWSEVSGLAHQIARKAGFGAGPK